MGLRPNGMMCSREPLVRSFSSYSVHLLRPIINTTATATGTATLPPAPHTMKLNNPTRHWPPWFSAPVPRP